MTIPAHAAHHAATQALKASGVVVRVEPAVFAQIVGRAESPLVIVSHGGVFKKQYKYLTSYKGLAFHAVSPGPIALPKAEVIAARSISIPDL